MTIPPEFLDELRARLALSELVGAKVALRRQGREHIGLCPFHDEKSPSFTVSDGKQFYHCFGCGAHGDAIRFVTETEGLSFREAVERLAGRAGLTVPRDTPEAAAQARRRASLIEVMERVTGWFESNLAAAAGAPARAYLEGRGLAPETIARFRIGFAPNHRSGLKTAMAARDIDAAQLVEAGMLIVPGDGDGDGGGDSGGDSAGDSYDRFRDRIIFPIWDRRGRVVAFGGRAMGAARAKYLNSPETPLFSKGRLLYNLHNARAASRAAGTVIAVEGYMDVIALAQAGFDHVVAPLGTALGEHQLAEMWRLGPEPVLCFDGDTAGLRAGYRVLERALPLLQPGYSLRFAFLPEGEDPDSLVRNRGAPVLDKIIAAASPLADVLWQAQVQRSPLDTPERRAGFQKNLDKLVAGIGDPKVRRFYQVDMAERLTELFPKRAPLWGDGSRGNWRRSWGRDKASPPRVGPRPETRRKQLGLAPEGSPVRRERLILLTIINHPWLLEHYMEQFAAVDISAVELDRMRNEIIDFAADHPDLDSETLKGHFQNQGFAEPIDALASRGALAGDQFARPETGRGEVERGWNILLARHGRAALEDELAAAEAVYGADDSESNWARLVAARAALSAAEGDEAEL